MKIFVKPVSIGFAIAGMGLSENTPITMGFAIIAAGLIWRMSAKLTHIEDSLKAHDGKLVELSNVRTYDIDTLRSDILSMIQGRTPSTAQLSDRPEREPLAILLVEDDQDFRMIFKRGLSSVFNLDEAGSLEEATIKLAKKDYACVILDLSLPDSIRHETVSKFVKRNPTALCVALSGHNDPIIMQKAIQDGADSFMDKNAWTPQYAVRIIQHAMHRRNMKTP